VTHFRTPRRWCSTLEWLAPNWGSSLCKSPRSPRC